MTGLRIGVAGVGRLGAVHARVISEAPGVSLAGVHDLDPEAAGRVSALHGRPAFADPEDLWTVSDAVIVAVPSSSHHDVAAAALAAGCHVLVEKPLASSLSEADDLIGRAATADRFLAVGHVERFNPIIRASRSFIADPRFITCLRLAPFQARGTDVPVTLDLMIHDIDLVLGLVDSPVRSFETVGVPLLTDTVDMVNARLSFENGAVADISASRVSRQSTRELRIFQETGYLSLDLGLSIGTFLRRLPGGPRQRQGTPSLADVVERMEIQTDSVEPLRAQLEAFVAAIRGATSPVVTGEMGRDALAVVLDISREIERTGYASATHS